MKRSYPSLLTILVILFAISACKKQAPECSGNCTVINANGNVIDKLASTSAAGVPVFLSWVTFSGGLSQTEIIGSVLSKSDGAFDFTVSIDTGYFARGYSLALSVGSSSNYIILGYSGTISKRIFAFDYNAFQHVQLEVYKKATLKIKLHRIQTDGFKSFSIAHSSVVNDFFIYDYNVQSPQEVDDKNISEISISTVADVFTKINVVKTFANGSPSNSLDSVMCSADTPGVYDVNF